MADKTTKVAVTITADTGNSGQKVKEVKGGLDGVTQSTKKTNEALKSMPGPLGNIAKGFDGLLKGFKAIISNPLVLTLGLIVGALATLYKAFTSTAAGADKVEQIMAGVSATMDVLRDRVLKVGDSLIKFFSGDFKGAAESAKNAFKGMGDEIADEFNKAAQATKVLQDIDDAVRELGISRAKLSRDLAEAKEIITDETASYIEKKKALDLVKKAEGEQTSKELENAKLKLQAQQDLNALSDTSRADKQKEADLQSAVFALEQKSAQDRRVFNKQQKLIDREDEAKRKADKDKTDKEEEERLKKLDEANKIINDAYISGLTDRAADEYKLAQAQNERLKALKLAGITDTALIDEQYEKEKAAIVKKYTDLEKAIKDEAKKKEDADKATQAAKDKEAIDKKRADDILGIENKLAADALSFETQRELAKQREDILLSDTSLTENQKVAIRKQTSNAIGQIDEKEANAKIQYLQAVGNATEVLSDIVGKQTAAGKALGIASAIMNTYIGASEVIRAKSTIPEPFGTISKIANVAAIISTGLKTVRSITAVQVPGGYGGGGGSIPSMSVSAPLQSQPATTTLNQAQVNQIGNVAARAYVVESDVTSAQERANRLNRAATIQ